MIVERVRKSRQERRSSGGGGGLEDLEDMSGFRKRSTSTPSRDLLVERDVNVSANFSGLKADELRSVLKERGLSTAGNKEALKMRLREEDV
jgi:hypothetical protein